MRRCTARRYGLASVSPWPNSDSGSRSCQPITISDRHRLAHGAAEAERDRREDPGARGRSKTPRTISQRVAPSASAPSRSSGGTVVNSSRVTLATIGTTMIVRTAPP